MCEFCGEAETYCCVCGELLASGTLPPGAGLDSHLISPDVPLTVEQPWSFEDIMRHAG